MDDTVEISFAPPTDTVEAEISAIDIIEVQDLSIPDIIEILQKPVDATVEITNQEDPDIAEIRELREPDTIEILMVGTTPGPQGSPGTGGGSGGNTCVIVAGINLGGQRVIATDTSGMAQYADNLSLYKTVTGISKTAVSLGELVEVETFGIVSDPSWNWDVTKDIFLGQNGLIVQDVPITGAIVNLGHVVSPTSIFLNIDDFIERG